MTSMFSTDTAQQLSATLFGVRGLATSFPGEADYNFHIKTPEGSELLLKIAHTEEKKSNLDLQNAVLQWLGQSPRSFTFPQLRPTLHGEWIGFYQASTANTHFVRLFNFLPGTLFAQANHSSLLLKSLGQQLGHLSQALTGFQHEAAKRSLRWDLKQADWIGDHLFVLDEVLQRPDVEFFLYHFKQMAPTLNSLRHSVIHGDINDYNVLVRQEQVAGFIDFGDVVESATVCELAIAIAYAIMNQADPLSAAATLVEHYHAIYPLLDEEINLLFTLIGMRLCTSVVNSALRKQEQPDNAYLTISEKPAWQLLKQWRHIDPLKAQQCFRQACHNQPTTPTSELLAARRKYIGKNVKLAYEQPLHIVRGDGQYLFDAQGRRYLDCVNNIAHVGHCHPHVVAAGQQQMAILNTNTRYLHDSLTRYAERLLATLPASLEVCFLVCSGSEANELALRLARTHTGRHDLVVMDHGYHGNTSTLIDISPYKFNGAGGQGQADFVQILPLHQTSNLAIEKPVAAFIGESLLSCGGQVVLSPAYVQQIYAAVRSNGGVCIADEVQVGLGRVGSHFWGFETQGVIPDIVTMGKPLGNGHPIGAVVTTREIADSFCNGMEYFNSFGGNPVSCSIGLAVLDVIEQQHLQRQALDCGNYLKQHLEALQHKHALIREVRGLGLFLGIELINDHQTLSPATQLTTQLVNDMKNRSILLSSDGPGQNVIKIKPPLVFTQQDCDFLLANLDEALAQLE